MQKFNQLLDLLLFYFHGNILLKANLAMQIYAHFLPRNPI
jgi:hypothetical protein